MAKSSLPTVTVGLAAFNEAKNIQSILRDILDQECQNCRLTEIIVSCDGCSDNTVELANSVNSPLITVIDNRDRKGKMRGLQQIFATAKSDFIIFFDADEKLANRLVITDLAAALSSDPECMVVGGNTRPFLPETFVERAVYSTFEVFAEARQYVKGGHNIFGCNGGCIGVRTSFVQKLKLENVVNEDDFLYFSCLKGGYTFKHVPSAVVNYKLPKTWSDFLRQSFRSDPGAVVKSLDSQFGELVAKEYHRPLGKYLASIAKAWLRNPIGVTVITLVKLACVPFYGVISKNYKLEWYTASSTK